MERGENDRINNKEEGTNCKERVTRESLSSDSFSVEKFTKTRV